MGVAFRELTGPTMPILRQLLWRAAAKVASDPELRAKAADLAERELRPHELYAASEVFLTSSVTGVRPLAAVDGRSLPESAPVCDAYHAAYDGLDGDRF